jgi:hypothetical protein
LGTYRPRGDNTVYLEIQEKVLIIRADLQGEILAKHPICYGQGELIKNTQHSRDRSKGIQAYKETVIRQFKDQKRALQFVNEVAQKYPRYVRDQLQVIQYAITHFRPQIEESLSVCIKEQLWSANDFRDIAQHLTRLKETTEETPSSCEAKKDTPALKATATTREMDYYTNLIRGVS